MDAPLPNEGTLVSPTRVPSLKAKYVKYMRDLCETTIGISLFSTKMLTLSIKIMNVMA